MMILQQEQSAGNLPLRQAKVTAITAMIHRSTSNATGSEKSSVSLLPSSSSSKQGSKNNYKQQCQGTGHLPLLNENGSAHKKRKKSLNGNAGGKDEPDNRADQKRRKLLNDTSSTTTGIITPGEPRPLPRRSRQKQHRPHRGSPHKNRATFPVKLFQLLESGQHRDAICWAPGGKSFLIKDKRRLESILPQTGFAHSGLRSFHRQCSYWCFTRCGTPDDNNKKKKRKNSIEEWCHPSFVEGMDRSALGSILRVSHKGGAGLQARQEGMPEPVKVSGGKQQEGADQAPATKKIEETIHPVAFWSGERPMPTNNKMRPRRISFEPEEGKEGTSRFLHSESPAMAWADDFMILHKREHRIEVEDDLRNISWLVDDDEEEEGMNRSLSSSWPSKHFFEDFSFLDNDIIIDGEDEEEDVLCSVPIADPRTYNSSEDDDECMSLQDFWFADSEYVDHSASSVSTEGNNHNISSSMIIAEV